MNIASLENCKRLYELSGWKKGETFGKNDWWVKDDDGEEYSIGLKSDSLPEFWDSFEYIAPAYSAGYLLRKLPEFIELTKKYQDFGRKDIKGDHRSFGWQVVYRHQVNDSHSSGIPKITTYRERADTAENCLCLLAIKLFEEGVLKKA